MFFIYIGNDGKYNERMASYCTTIGFFYSFVNIPMACVALVTIDQLLITSAIVRILQ